MYSKAKIGGHPVHPMLVSFPIAFYVLAFVGFTIFQFVNRDVFWYRLAYFSTFAGIAMAVVAAVPGLIDWVAGIPKNTEAKRRGLVHMALNVATLVLFALCAYAISGTWDNPLDQVYVPFILSLVGVALTMAAGYHGFTLIARHKVGVELSPEQERLEPDYILGRNKTTEFDSRPQPVR